MADPKKCPNCGTEMKLEKRPRPESGAMFMGDDMWVCPKCLRAFPEVEQVSN